MFVIRLEEADALRREEVLALYESVGWSAYTRDPNALIAGLSRSSRLVTARSIGTGELAGLARCLTDGATIAFIQDVLVTPAAQRSGIGRQLVETLLDVCGPVRQQVLLTDDEPSQRAFYEALGFTETHDRKPALRAFVRTPPTA